MTQAHACPAVISSCPFLIPASQERITVISFLHPFLLLPTPPPSVFLRLSFYLFLSDRVSGDERHLLPIFWRYVTLLIYVRGQGLVCILWHWESMANRWWGSTCMAYHSINKIFYGNASEERERCDFWYVGLLCICIQRRWTMETHIQIHNHLCTCNIGTILNICIYLCSYWVHLHIYIRYVIQ